ncbi:unnamed protein product, partial [Symbiodinium sp. CCMP2456]
MNILLPTDFSENADLACQYAFDIAKRSKGKVTVINAYDLPYSDRSMTTSLLEVMKENAEKNMAAFQRKLKDKYDVPFTTEVRLGNPIRLIKEMATEESIDLVVMGTKGASGLEEILIGSNAASVIQNSDKPVLVIPPDANGKPLQKIVFASDFDMDNMETAFKNLNAFAELNEASIDVLHVQNDVKSKAGTRDAIQAALQNRVKEFTILQTDNVEEAIIKEAKKENADVI